MLNINMLSGIMLYAAIVNIVMLSAIILSVVMLIVMLPFHECSSLKVYIRKIRCHWIIQVEDILDVCQ